MRVSGLFDLMTYHVLCFELSGLLDGQIMKAVTLQANSLYHHLTAAFPMLVTLFKTLMIA